MALKVLALIILSLLSGPASAGFTVKDLEETARYNEVLYEGYVGGAAEALVITKICCPNNVTFTHLAKIIKSELRKLQLEEMRGDAILFVAVVLKKLFPCKR